MPECLSLRICWNGSDSVCDFCGKENGGSVIECDKNKLMKATMEKPKVIVLCGSTRYVDIFAVAGWLLEKEEGAITMGLHLLPGWYCKEDIPDHLAEHEGVKEHCDNLHMRKIDLADEIFVVNVYDYIGNSTKREIAYAKEKGLPLRWYTSDPIGRKVDSIIQDAIKREQAAKNG